jgi:glycosyltransferase involved in cell wall biosynthesis
VLHVLNEVDDSSISFIVQQLIINLNSQCFNWHIGSLNGLGLMEEKFKNIGAHVVDFSGKQQRKMNSLRNIREYIIAHRINIVHTHSLRAIFILYLALIDKSETIHVATKHTLFAPSDRRWGLQYAALDRIGLYLPDHVVTVSRAMHHQISSYPGMGNRVTTICNGIPCKFFYKPNQRDMCRTELGLAPESLVIGYTGRIEKVKRLDLLLTAFASTLKRYPNTRLIIVGEGDLKLKLEKFAAQLGISDAVIWTGFRKDIPRLLASMDIFVQTSVNEGMSLSILEAMAAEKAIIATRVGGASELLEDGITGLLIAPRNVLSIENAIFYLLEHPEIRSEIANAARSFVLRHFDTGRMARDYQQLYESLMAQR